MQQAVCTSATLPSPDLAAGKRAGKSFDGTCRSITAGSRQDCTAHPLASALVVQLQTTTPPAPQGRRE